MSPFRSIAALGFLGLSMFQVSHSAPLPSPWHVAETAIHALGTLPYSNSLSDHSQAQIGQEVLIGRRPQITQANQVGCGRVEVYARAELDESSALPIQTLSRSDAGLSCTFSDRFGADITYLDDQTLVISATGGLADLPGTEASPGELFFYQKSNASQTWQLVEYLSGSSLNLNWLGHSLDSDGERLFMINHLAQTRTLPFSSETRTSARNTGVVILQRDSRGQWQRQSVLTLASNDGPALNRYYLSGDQILSVLDNTEAVTVLEETHTGQGDWSEVQRLQAIDQPIAQGQIDGLLAPRQVNADWLITRTEYFTNENEVIDLGANVFRRDYRGQWQFHQRIDLSQTGRDLGEPLVGIGRPFLNLQFDTTVLSGADLVFAWLQENRNFQLVHYRLNQEQKFTAIQHLGTSTGFGSGSPQMHLSDQGLLVPRFDGTSAFYQRESGSNFAINRGLSGGWWFGPQRNGQGVGLEILPNNRVQMVWLTHDLSGQQQWLFGAGDIDVDRVRIDLLQPVGGEFGPDFDNSSVQRLPWGQVELVFSSCEQGELRYQSNTQGSGTLPLLRLSKVDGLDCGDATASPLARRWTGSWFDPSHNGEGLMMHVTPSRNGPRLSALWMTYQPDGRQAAFYTATDINSAQSAQFNSVIRPTGLNFDGSGVLQRNPWGRFDLSSSQCDRSLLSYQSELADYGVGQLNLVRFTRPLGAGCF